MVFIERYVQAKETMYTRNLRIIILLDNTLLKELINAKNGQGKQFLKLFSKELARKQLQNLLMVRQRHLVFGGLVPLSRLNEINDHIIQQAQLNRRYPYNYFFYPIL